MTNDPDIPVWESARLIPVSGIRNAEEQERRATSALLAVLSAVDEFGVAITKPSMFCSTDSHSLKKNHESIASARSIRGFFTRPRATLGKPAVQNGYQSL